MRCAAIHTMFCSNHVMFLVCSTVSRVRLQSSILLLKSPKSVRRVKRRSLWVNTTLRLPLSRCTVANGRLMEIHVATSVLIFISAGSVRGGVQSNRYNVIMIGDSSVGKTSFMKRAQSGKFSLDLPSSIGKIRLSCFPKTLLD